VLRCATAVAALVSSTSRARVDLPEPLTPVTTTKRCRGTATVRFCRLCRRAPRISNQDSPSPLLSTLPSATGGIGGKTVRRGCSGCCMACSR